jgi:hypothetical protein
VTKDKQIAADSTYSQQVMINFLFPFPVITPNVSFIVCGYYANICMSSPSTPICRLNCSTAHYKK